MYTFTVNGAPAQAREEKTLLSFLRDDLRLTSVKDGCAEGVCGTCTVLLDGKAVRACTQKVSKLDGRSIVTVEGISAREREVYLHCFAAAGAVQCGFCIPGMVMAAKGLLDITPSPAPDDVRRAIRGNLCRCTGYKKIEEAILDAARYFRENLPVPPACSSARLGERAPRADAPEKILGTGLYADDLVLPGMIYAKALRSRYPRARVNRIDADRALSHPDTVRILTAKDVPENRHGHLKQDWDVMIAEGEITRYIGDAIALVATTRKESLDEVLALIDVDYTVLEPVTNPRDAMREGAPALHPGGNVMRRELLRRGDAEGAIAGAKYVVTRRYRTPYQEHAFLEPECAVAEPDGAGGLILYTGAQSVYDDQHEVSRMLGLPPEKVRCRSMLVGGGFGGKEDMSVQHHAALMAYHTGRPVKVRFSRQESMNYHTKRHPMEIEMTTACDENGYLTAMKAVLIADTGAYASLGGPVLQRACTHAAGPYHYRNIDIEGLAVYTNNPVSGAFRGFGVTQSCFATELNINELARMAGLSPWEIRYRNAIRPGQSLPNGQLADESTAMAECLTLVKDVFESNPRAGIACGMKNSGVGVGLPDIGRVLLSVEDGIVHIRTSAACMGQGIAAMCAHMVCETTGLSPGQTLHEAPDTARTPDSGTSTASRQTVFTGEAARRAALRLKEALDEAGGDLRRLEGQCFEGTFSYETDPMGSPKENPVSHVSYSYGAQVVELDESGKVTRVTAAYDVGAVVNPQSAEGQIEGGIVMGLGYALSEEFRVEGGYPQTTFGTLGLMRATDVPEIRVRFARGAGKIPFAYGAKGVGELCLIPTAPACAHAYERFDGKTRTSLPLEDTVYRKTKKGG